MSKQRTFFTEEQMASLRQNPYVYSVTQGTLALTKEFKEIFYAEYQSGILPRNILEQHGFDLNALGTHRIWSISQHIRDEYKKYGEFHEGYHARRSAGNRLEGNAQPPTEQEQLKVLQAKVDYLEQEMEFLKKISSIRNTRK